MCVHVLSLSVYIHMYLHIYVYVYVYAYAVLPGIANVLALFEVAHVFGPRRADCFRVLLSGKQANDRGANRELAIGKSSRQ